MQIDKVFPQIEEKNVEKIMKQYNIGMPQNYRFSPINIIIGSNGAGKTRFLNAIKDIYSLEKNVDIMYGYFPALSDKKIHLNRKNSELPESTLFDSMYMDDVSFSDFFKEIEYQNEDFIAELLEYHSQRQKKRGEKALSIVHDSFYALTGKELVNREGKIYVKSKDGHSKTLSAILDMLSPGELILFYMSIFLAIQQNGKKNKIIILDEPENHLHPKALISFIKMLMNAQEFTQIWIATHSLFLVPEFKFENIIYIKDGFIQKQTSKVYEKLFLDLLGDEDGKVKMFFSSLSQWKYCEFIAECFTNPTVIDTVNPEDEQVQLFIKYLNKHKPLRVLDCGGGSGRLGLSLEAAKIGEAGNIHYDIYDRSPTYTGDKFGVYTNLKDVLNDYDCVVMMNFLHEVEPKEWYHLFYHIFNLLHDGGYLLFVEVNALVQGENPNDVGYLILGREELEILFCDKQGLTEIVYKNDQKSSCILVPKASLLNVSKDSILKTISHLELRTFNELNKIRKESKLKKAVMDVSMAKNYAFLSQQYINAKLFMDDKFEIEEIKRIIINRQNAKQKLHEIMILLTSYWRQANKSTTNEIFAAFTKAEYYFQKNDISLEIHFAICWEHIIELKKKKGTEELIALLLVALTLMGDTRAENCLKNEGYKRFLPENIVVA